EAPARGAGAPLQHRGAAPDRPLRHGDPELRQAGARRPAPHRLGGRHPEPLLHLRERRGGPAGGPGRGAASGGRGLQRGERPRGGDGPRSGPPGEGPRGIEERGRPRPLRPGLRRGLRGHAAARPRPGKAARPHGLRAQGPPGRDPGPGHRLLHLRRGKGLNRAGLLGLPFAAGPFDGVTSFDVIYHAWVADDRAATREMARVLRPGGLMLVRVPALKVLWGGHDVAVQSRHRYTRAEMRALLEDTGLEVLRVTYANCFLFPLLLLRRTLDRITGRAGSDVGFLPEPFEWTFRRLLELEA